MIHVKHTIRTLYYLFSVLETAGRLFFKKQEAILKDMQLITKLKMKNFLRITFIIGLALVIIMIVILLILAIIRKFIN